MRNLYVIAVCIVMGIAACSSSAASLVRRKRKSDSRLKSFTERYALPTNIHSVTSQLPLTFGYRFTDDYGTTQQREEKTDPNGSKVGSYSFVDAAGLYRRVEYVADRNGFRATVKTNEPGTMPVDPAHVRMLADNKHINLGSFNHATGISPHLEFSSHIFSRYNQTGGYEGDDRNSPYPDRVHGIRDGPQPNTFESGRVQFENPKFFTNSHNPVSFSQEISSLIDSLEDPQPVAYVKPQHSNSDKFYHEQNGDYDLNNYGDKTPQGEYSKKVPTRYPRGHRNSGLRAKRYKIHVPKGYENHPNLPLYKDK